MDVQRADQGALPCRLARRRAQGALHFRTLLNPYIYCEWSSVSELSVGHDGGVMASARAWPFFSGLLKGSSCWRYIFSHPHVSHACRCWTRPRGPDTPRTPPRGTRCWSQRGTWTARRRRRRCALCGAIALYASPFHSLECRAPACSQPGLCCCTTALLRAINSHCSKPGAPSTVFHRAVGASARAVTMSRCAGARADAGGRPQGVCDSCGLGGRRKPGSAGGGGLPGL